MTILSGWWPPPSCWADSMRAHRPRLQTRLACTLLSLSSVLAAHTHVAVPSGTLRRGVFAAGARARVVLSSRASAGGEDLYAVLGIQADAAPQDVKRAYRRLAMRSHPDVNKSPTAAAEFNRYTSAYDTLIDPEARRAYDVRRTRRTPGAARGWSARRPADAPAESASERAARAEARRAAQGPMPDELDDSFGSLFGDVLKGVGKFVSELETEGGGLEDWLSYVETSAAGAAPGRGRGGGGGGGADASWAAEGDSLEAENSEPLLQEELDDLAFLARQLDERRLRLQEEVSRGEALAIELLSRARQSESAARRAAATEQAVEVRRETAATRSQCQAVLAHAFRVRARKERLEERLAELRRPPARGAPARPRSGSSTGPGSADFARRVDDDLRQLKEKLNRGG